MTYIFVVLVTNVIIIAVNAALGVSLYDSSKASVLGTSFVIFFDALTAFCIRRLPEKFFDARHTSFAAGKRECALYRKTGIKQWKKYVPELGVFTGFHKDKLESTTDTAYLARFILESNYGVAIHYSNALCGLFVPLLPFCRSATVWVPLFAVNFVLSIMPAALLRCNLMSIIKLYSRSIMKGDLYEKNKVER